MPSHWKQLKKQINHVKQRFSDIGHQAAQETEPWKMRNKQDEPCNYPSSLTA